MACDHDHSTQHCRGALNRNSNAFEGLVTNAYTRCLKWLTNVPLPDILRNLADYLEVDYTNNPYHVGWMKRVKIDFNKLSASKQNEVLLTLGLSDGKNLAERKQKFSEIVLDRNNGYDKIKAVIQQASA